jgi:hypothetical protein
MNITNTNSLNVSSAESSQNAAVSKQTTNNDSSTKFSDELKMAEKSSSVGKKQELKEESAKGKIKVEPETEGGTVKEEDSAKVDDVISGLNDTIDELNKLTQKDELVSNQLKQNNIIDDINKKNEVYGLIDNNMNIQEPQDKLNLQAGTNMNFNSDAQPFAEFVPQENSRDLLKSSAKDLAEEKAILSTMEENIAIANKNIAMARTKTVENEHGIQKVDKKTNLVTDTIVSYDRVVMDRADVEFFANLVENGVLNMNDIQNAEKSSRVSKALADLLAKAMNENKPVRIDFDNNISVIIKIDRAGKISADFLPSSQVAEAYLKENLPLLKQRFDENNIDYNELNQRQRKQEQDNRKKGRKDE